MTFWPTSISCVDFFLCDFRWSTGREKSWEVCSSVNIHCKHTWAPSILHASSGAPGVPLLQQLPLSWWEQQRFVCLFLNFIQVDIYTAHAQSYSGSFTQYHVCSLYSESVGQCPCTVSVCVFVSPVVVFHCLTESQFICPFSLSTSGSFPIFF